MYVGFHPAAELFPLLDGGELDALKADIAEHGQREPIWMTGGEILDGRNRWRACQELGRECEAREYEGDDPIGFVVSLNLHRRHLSESQRAMVAAQLATMAVGRPSANVPDGTISQSDAATLLNVSRHGVIRARHVIDHAPALIPAVQQALLKVAAADQIARHAPDAVACIAEAVSRGDSTAASDVISKTLARIRGAGEVPHGRPALAAPPMVRMTDTDRALQVKAVIAELAAIAIPPELIVANLPRSSWDCTRSEIDDAIEFLVAFKEAIRCEEFSH